MTDSFSMKKPKLQNFNDYRDFLKKWHEYRKFKNEFWSYGMWIKKLELKNASSLSMIIKKQRHISKKLLPNFLTYFDFNKEDEAYFIEMIKIAKATKGDQKLTVYLVEKNLKSKDKFTDQIVFNWRTYLLREMASLKDFESCIDWRLRRSRIKLEKDEVQNLIERMKKEEFISSEEVPKNSILPKGKFTKLDAELFHSDLMTNSKNAIHIEQEKRALHASTLSIKANKIKEAKELIRDFQIEFSKLVEQTPGDEIYQLNIQFFPLTE